MNNKFYSILGLAQKARGIVSGEDMCSKTIASNKALFVIIASDASDNTKKKFVNMCKYRNVNYKFYGDKESLGKALGKIQRSVIAVIDVNFKKSLINLIDDSY